MPEISINNMKHSFHLPLLDPHNYNMLNSSNLQQHQQQHNNQHNNHSYQHQLIDSALNTPMSLGGTSTFSDLSPMTMHPGIGMVNALINDFGNMDLRRKAPGCERSNTAPNLFVNIPSGNGLLDGKNLVCFLGID
jgi:hypothetical protein